MQNLSVQNMILQLKLKSKESKQFIIELWKY